MTERSSFQLRHHSLATFIMESKTLCEIAAKMIISLQGLSHQLKAVKSSVVVPKGSSNSESSNSGASTSGTSTSETTTSAKSISGTSGEPVEQENSGDTKKLAATPMKSGEPGKSDQTNETESDSSSTKTKNKANALVFEAYKDAIEQLVIRLRNWRVILEEEKYHGIDFDGPLPIWTRKDRKLMRIGMYKISYEIRKQKIIDKMAELNEISKKMKDTKLAEEMVEMLLQDIYLLRVTPCEYLMFPLSMEDIYDWNKVSAAIEGRHTPAECLEFWNTKFHPSVRNKSWSKAETRLLATLADQNNMNHWDVIAAQLNTERTPFQCFLQYRRYIHKEMLLQKKIKTEKK